MFLDLWSLAILTGDLLELIVNHIESGTLSVSLPFLLFLIVFAAVSSLAWRSTFIPDLPPAPRPPYVIQISSSSTPVYVNGERNTLADVRLLSSGADVDNVLRRFPHQGVNRIHLGGLINPINITRTRIETAQQQQLPRASLRVYPQQQVQQRPNGNGTNGVSSSVLLGYLRPGSVIRPFIGNRPNTGNQAQNLIVYHRVNVYHHHHHHHHPSTQSTANSTSEPIPSTSQSIPQPQEDQPTADNSISNSSSVADSSTQFDNQSETHDLIGTGDNSDNLAGENHILTNPVEIEVPPININMNSDGGVDEEITIHSTDGESGTSSMPSIPPTTTLNEGLRQRTTVNTTTTGESSENTHPNRDEGDSKNETDKSSQSQVKQSIPTTTSDGANGLRFTIKFLNDTQKEVTSQIGEKILDFKRRHFATELSENKTVRLIFNGRVLDNDTSTLGESGIFEQCVVHCLIVARPTAGGNSPSDANSASSGLNQGTGARRTGLGSEPGMFFVSFVGVFLIFLWFICFHFGNHLFSQSAVVSLTVLTAIFLIGLVAFYLPVHPNPNT